VFQMLIGPPALAPEVVRAKPTIPQHLGIPQPLNSFPRRGLPFGLRDASEGLRRTDLNQHLPFTTHLIEPPLLRLPIKPSDRNGLRAASQLMIDKVAASKTKLKGRFGRLSGEDTVRLNRAVLVFLGLAGVAPK
jgi:hypothetical protein